MLFVRDYKWRISKGVRLWCEVDFDNVFPCFTGFKREDFVIDSQSLENTIFEVITKKEISEMSWDEFYKERFNVIR